MSKVRCDRCNWIALDGRLILQVHGGYEDMVDTEADIMTGTDRDTTLLLCHSCGHKLINWIGNEEWIRPMLTTSHDRRTTSDWHLGWDNRTIKGYIACFFMTWRYFSLTQALKEVKYLSDDGSNDRLQKHELWFIKMCNKLEALDIRMSDKKA